MSAAAVDFGEIAARRRSVRHYLERSIGEPDLRALLEAATRAPSAWNLQPWRFVVAREAGLRLALQRAAFGQRQVAAAPAVIVLYSDMQDALARTTSESARAHFAALPAAEQEAWGAAQANIALGWLLLVAEGMQLATSPMLGFDPAAVRAGLELAPHAPIAALVAIGYAAEAGAPSPRRSVDEITAWR